MDKRLILAIVFSALVTFLLTSVLKKQTSHIKRGVDYTPEIKKLFNTNEFKTLIASDQALKVYQTQEFKNLGKKMGKGVLLKYLGYG